MRSLTSARLLDGRRDRGAVSIVVALTLVFILLPMTAFVANAGSLYLGRQDAQNGADAAALALAKACATGQPTCTTDIAGTGLNPLVAANVSPGTAELSAPPCIQRDGVLCQDSDLEVLADCPYALPAELKGVQVRARADLDLPFPFLGGGEGHPATCASAAWGGLGSADNTLPVVLNQCGWDAATDGGTDFGPQPPYSPVPNTSGSGPIPEPPATAAEHAVAFYTHKTGKNNDPTICGRGSAGKYYAGGFGWVSTPDSSRCAASFTYDHGTWVMPGDNGASVPDGCKGKDGAPNSLLYWVGKTVFVPIVTGVDGSNYLIDGLAAFYVAGYSGAAAHPKNYDGYQPPAGIRGSDGEGGDFGLWGWFTAPIVPVGSLGTGTERGPIVISMVS